VVAQHVLAIDQGTTSTRAIIFDESGSIVAKSQREHEQHFPRAGWVEHDPSEIWDNTLGVIESVIGSSGLGAEQLAAIGITNQRETVVVWDARTGEPVYNAIVWQDTRTQQAVDRLAEHGGVTRFADKTGLPLSTYFSATKVAWILDTVPGARARADAGELLFGTTDTWLLWNLTGGVAGGVHATDVTNASRTQLMNLQTLDWDDELLEAFTVPRSMLPDIRSSSDDFGVVSERHPLAGVPISGILGDQQAATFGQAAFAPGEAKNTYGTGNFLIINTGTEIVRSTHGLLSTVAYRLGDGPAHYALEGSIAVTGSLVQWLRDSLEFATTAEGVAELAATVDDNGGAYVVPAFSGLYAPHWRPDARGVIVGLTSYVTKAHIARAALESTAFQTWEVLEAANADAGAPLSELKVDGGMTVNSELMQFQADILGLPVVRPVVAETTALGAAYAAGLAVGVWKSQDELKQNWKERERWVPRLDPVRRDALKADWKRAVSRTLDWVAAD
jgi:glycerol kinase